MAFLICCNRNECEKVAASLQKEGFTAEPYHAGLTDTKRNDVSDWIGSQSELVVKFKVNWGYAGLHLQMQY